MPIELRPVPEHNVTILAHIGVVPDDEFLSFYRSFFESDLFDASMNLLVDLSEADSRPRSPETLREFAQFMQGTLAATTGKPKVAVVAPKDLSFGLARMYEVFAMTVPWEFVVFRAMDAALAWLGLPEVWTSSAGEDAK